MRSILRRAFWPGGLFVLLGLGQAAQADVDSALREAAAADLPAYLNAIERLATIESRSSDGAGLAAVADVLRQRLDALGFKTSCLGSVFGMAESVVGFRSGSGEQRGLLMAHMDTVDV